MATSSIFAAAHVRHAAAPAHPLRDPLIVRLPNWVGDVCMALPALEALATLGLPMVAFAKGWAIDLLAGHPALRMRRLPTGLWAARQAIRDHGVHAIPGTRARDGLLFTNSLGSALQFRLAGIAACGHAGEGRSPLLALAIPKTGPHHRPAHEVQVFWRLARETARHLGAGNLPEHPPAHLGLRLTETHRQHAEQALTAAGVAGPYVVLAPLAAGTIRGRSKLWPGFAELCRRLRDGGETVVACPGPGEDAACAAALPGAILLPGLGLGAYAAVCAQARVTVANDSGPMHLAAAVDAPVAGIFGVSDPGRTRPWSPRALVLGSAAGWPGVDEVFAAVAP